MSAELVQSKTENNVAAITLNRPDALNAFTPDLLRALISALEAAEKSARVIILEGAGRAFSAGVDLKLLQGATFKEGKVDDVFDGASFAAVEAIRHASVPVIAKVHGFCFTGALELALHADFILTTADTKFGDTHAKWGLRPSWGMSQNLARAVGVRRARELSFTAATFSGADAERWGLATAVFADKDALDAETHKRAAAIAEASPGAIAAYKDLYRLHEENRPLESALEEEVARNYPDITDTMDRLKGIAQ
ncbi:enoyl-CoA hydratase/isomerase family protein [Hyphococcus flavus]|uniref:Enoyl-CoA hydratase/isomerase family protein n=1 Tax=Hyphococcus flavus TaxID=1866326 RepID=A0AAF0CFV9_9PROT|nr:enoyl-CoA hydratase/isomerase family protein [Hyphococcus flavus]WDI30012.1 enoyl-CoA hydratase/isomerase family protein [Hyphococcus flavus]